MAVLNTELNFALLEMRQMRLQAEEDRRVIAQLQTQLTGVAPPLHATSSPMEQLEAALGLARMTSIYL
jgi:hypothetical protein